MTPFIAGKLKHLPQSPFSKTVRICAFAAGSAVALAICWGFGAISASREAPAAYPAKASEAIPVRKTHRREINPPGRPLIGVMPPGKTCEQVVQDLEGKTGEPVPSLNLSEWKLGPADSLEALESLLAEVRRQHGGDTAAALAWLSARLIEGKDLVSLTALAGEAVSDDEVLRQTAAALEKQGMKYMAAFARSSFAQFAIHDPSSGFRWLEDLNKEQTQKSGEVGSPLLSALSLDYSKKVVGHLLEEGPESAVVALEAIRRSSSSGAVLQQEYLNRMAQEDSEALWKAATASGVPVETLTRTMAAVAAAAPKLAADQLVVSKLSDPVRQQAEKELLRTWANSAPKEAFSWLSQHRAQWQSSSPMVPIFSQWTARDSLEATTALATLPEGNDRDDAISGAVPAMAEIDPETAVLWIQRIADPAKRKAMEAKLSQP